MDDIRIPKTEGWDIVRNYDEFVAWIRLNGIPDEVSFDHDLAEIYYNSSTGAQSFKYYEKTGYDAAKFLVAESMNTKIPLPQIYIHSANPIGSSNMMGYINNYLMNCRLPQTCIRVKIEHTIDEHLTLSEEVRKLKWDRSENKF